MTITDWLARVAGFLRPRARAVAAAPLARRLSIVSAGLGQLEPASCRRRNQQKVTVARALARKPRLIVAITPTRGVDVASKSLLLAELARVTDETGAGLLLASDELDDLVICDRVIVLVQGRAVHRVQRAPVRSRGSHRGQSVARCECRQWHRSAARFRSRGVTMSETPNAPDTAVADRGRAAVEVILQGRSRSAVAISLASAKQHCSPSLSS